jgi:PAS domain S-box-containing protein
MKVFGTHGRHVLAKKTSYSSQNVTLGPRSLFERMALAALVLLIGGLVTVLYVQKQRDANIAAAQRELEATTERFAKDLHDRLQTYEYGLRGARGAFVAMGPDQVSRDAFLRYIDTEFPGARGFGFIRKVPLTEMEEFLLFQHENGVPDFRIKQLSEHSGVSFIIQYIEPIDRNREALGLDIASERNRRTAAIEAALSGKAAITEPITILQATGATNRGFLVLLPVYKNGLSDTESSLKMDEIVGWTYAPLVLDEVINGLIDKSASLYWTISDLAENGQKSPVLSSGISDPGADSMTSTKRLVVFNRGWEVTASASPAFIAKTEKVSPAVVGWTGSGITVLAAVIIYLWGTVRRRKLDELELQARLATVIENTHQAVVGTDDTKKVVLWNRSAEVLFDARADDVFGRELDEVLASKDLSIEERQRAGVFAQGELVLRGQGRPARILVVSTSPILASDGRSLGSASFMLDVTEERRAKQRAAKDTEDFAYTVAHDLRTPLRSVNGFAAMLLESEGDRLTDAGKISLSKVVHSSQRMGMMLTNLIDYLHIVKYPISIEQLDMTSIARKVIAQLTTELNGADVSVHAIPEVCGDQALITRLLKNLLDNSIKYSSPDRQLRIHIGFDEAESAYFIRDNGIGFDPDNSSKLFGLFQRLEAHPAIPGLGVGLAIARRIVEKHAGRIWAHAEKGVGATVFFHIPSLPGSSTTRSGSKTS